MIIRSRSESLIIWPIRILVAIPLIVILGIPCFLFSTENVRVENQLNPFKWMSTCLFCPISASWYISNFWLLPSCWFLLDKHIISEKFVLIKPVCGFWTRSSSLKVCIVVNRFDLIEISRVFHQVDRVVVINCNVNFPYAIVIGVLRVLVLRVRGLVSWLVWLRGGLVRLWRGLIWLRRSYTRFWRSPEICIIV